jgi:hypothetical protein
MQIGAVLKQLLEFNAELGPVLATVGSDETPSKEQAVRLAAKQKRVRGQLLQLKPKKLGPLPKGFPNLDAIGRQSPADEWSEEDLEKIEKW